jgi:hypothetical protein
VLLLLPIHYCHQKIVEQVTSLLDNERNIEVEQTGEMLNLTIKRI